MKIPKLCYNAMFKAVFSNNKLILTKLIEVILTYCKMNIDIHDKDLIIKNNELPLDNYQDRQLMCDYVIKLNDHVELNIEINKAYYPGLTERNLTYSFKIYYEHFKSGDTYTDFNKYCLLQVNFNHFKNANQKTVNRFFLLDVDDITNSLSKNLCILNVDIASCFKLVYNDGKLQKLSYLERFGAILYAESLEDISAILGSDMLNMTEKKQFLDDIKAKACDKEVLDNLKFEDSINYRFDLVQEEALGRGIEQGVAQGIEQTLTTNIQNMIKKNISIEDIADITGKTIQEVKEIIQSPKK